MDEESDLERDPEQEEEEEEEWNFDPAEYQQLMEQQLIPNYLDYKDYKEDYYPLEA